VALIMQRVIAPRASTILYDLLVGMPDRHVFLLPANICPIVPLTFLKAETPFEFVDISSETFHMDLEQVQAILRRRKTEYAGLLYSHTYGDPRTPNAQFRELKLQNPDLLIIDDRCLCLPELEPNPTSAAGVVLYSTGYAKIVDLGYGGYAFLDDNSIYTRHVLPYDPESLDAIEQDSKRSIAAGTAYTYRDSDWLRTDPDVPAWPEYADLIKAALEPSCAQRETINSVYDAVIPAYCRLAPEYQLWRYNVLVKDKNKVLAAIFSNGLFASGHYASLAGVFGAGRGPAAKELGSRVINLFNDHHYSLEMAERTAQIVLGSL
jgi:hypothetical protein